MSAIHHYIGDPMPPPQAPVGHGGLALDAWDYSHDQIHPPEQQHQLDIVHGNINSSYGQEASELAAAMDQIEAQMFQQQQQAQHQAQTQLQVQHMVPMPMPRVQPPQLAIENIHPQDVHIETVHPQFHHIGPPPHQPPIHHDHNEPIHPQFHHIAPPPNHQAFDFSNTYAHAPKHKKTYNSPVEIHISSDDDLDQSSSAAAASSSSAAAASSSAAAAAPAKAKPAAVHSLTGPPPKPHANIARFKLDAELANAYAKGLITDPEDIKEYEKIMDDKEYRKTGGYNRDTSGITKNTLIAIYRRIYPKIKNR